MKIQFKKPSERDIDYVLKNPAEFSRAELDRFGFLLNDSLRRADAVFCGYVNSTPICLCVVERKTLIDGGGYVWMVLGKGYETHAVTFARHSRKILKMLLEHYDSLTVISREDNALSRKWLEWLGFRIKSLNDYGPFRGFEMRVEK